MQGLYVNIHNRSISAKENVQIEFLIELLVKKGNLRREDINKKASKGDGMIIFINTYKSLVQIVYRPDNIDWIEEVKVNYEHPIQFLTDLTDNFSTEIALPELIE